MRGRIPVPLQSFMSIIDDIGCTEENTIFEGNSALDSQRQSVFVLHLFSITCHISAERHHTVRAPLLQDHASAQPD